ncbi:hypothetical protein A7U60_g5431 [Sanghuangporus baumii]|uniref:Uncharacterized protein n=1 Tax=Sanghuangporus baumii TaxID=108892 RepID=A0A9Q5N864_SANBA|nr:hypothetical protein A7U60_g5431 [Sanghuangporus baumii]
MSSHSPSPTPGMPRKAHCCRSCGMPMKGHQRGACVPSNFMHPQASSPLMPPPDTIPSGPSQPNARFPSPHSRPVMPGAYGGERPSEISVSTGLSGPSPTARSLRDRIGAKVEEESTFAMPHYVGENLDPQYARYASAPVPGYAGRMFGGSASAYAASASGSAYGSSSTVLMPEHSISQRFIRRDRPVSEGTNPLSGRIADRLGGYTSDDFIGPDNDFDDEGSFEYDDSFDNDDESESDPAYPSDGSAIGGGASASYYASESEAGTYTSAGHSSAPSFGALMRGSGAAPLYTVYEVASKYVRVLRKRAERKGLSMRVIPNAPDEFDEYGRRKRTSQEPGNVRILLGRDADALLEVERQHASGIAMAVPIKHLRMRGRASSDGTEARHSSPLAPLPAPPHAQTPYPVSQPGIPYPSTAAPAVQQLPPQPSVLGSLCLTVTATIATLIVLLFAGLGFYLVIMQSSSE